MGMTSKVIEFENVSFSYEDHPVLSRAAFAINKGDFFVLMGPNGGGKTTVVKLILGLLRPDAGHVRLFGREAGTSKELQKVGYVPQKVSNFDQNFPATVFEAASMGRFAKIGIMHRVSKSDYAAVEKALDDVGMLGARDKRVGDLSGGQQQRVFIARALAAEPEILILDEPVAGVDSESQARFYELLKRLNRERGMTLVLVSHDAGQITKMSGSVTKLACVNVSVSVHDISKGIKKAKLICSYPADFEGVPHHHD